MPPEPRHALIAIHWQHDVPAELLNPAEVRILTVPTPDTGHRYGDVVLLDHTTLGTRTLSGQTMPVWNTLGLVRASPFEPWEAWVTLAADDDSDGGRQREEGPGVVMQNQTAILGQLAPPASGLREEWRHNPRKRPC
ncbi:hypothetical protein [Deinococcus navajonensis]|uniref:PemK-like, MazF-like toxin of type II toxin-antitoxin system n=1 Tax=Deinococcus navajonensis TaxID=309884 RepID=A0ABV8XI49_9DEIO